MNFGSALTSLKIGGRVAREGWNGRGMFIYLVEGSEIRAENLRNEALEHVGYLQPSDDTLVKISSHIDMKAADGSITIGWNPSQIDMLAEDWIALV
jgi:hypothetical protein